MPEDEQKYKVRFADEIKKEFRKLGHSARVAILSSVEKMPTTKPDEYGEPLVRELVGYRKLPVGQWRVVYYVDKGQILVLVLAVGKRAEGDNENIYDHITRDDLDLRREESRRRIAEEKERG